MLLSFDIKLIRQNQKQRRSLIDKLDIKTFTWVSICHHHQILRRNARQTNEN